MNWELEGGNDDRKRDKTGKGESITDRERKGGGIFVEEKKGEYGEEVKE
jgi:hypothetical protein